MVSRFYTSYKALYGLLAIVLAVSGCDRPPKPASPPTPEVGVVTMKSTSVRLQAELPGRTVASLVADVRPQVSGIVTKRLFEEGADVKAGQLLYQIDPSYYQAAYEQAQADLSTAQAGVESTRLKDERYTQLIEIQGVSKQDADEAHASFLQAKASVEMKKATLQTARINLGYAMVRAPVAGRIGKSSVTSGALVTANQEAALATIRALDPIYVDLTESSTKVLQLRKLLSTQGMQSGLRAVHLLLEDGTQYAETGTLRFQEVSVDSATGSVTLRAQFPNPRGELLPGMYVRAVLDEAQSAAALLAPQQAISRDTNGNGLAMVVGADDKVEQRTVMTSRIVGSDWLVTSGLSVGDRLIVEGLNKIRPGQPVRAIAAAVKKP